MDPSAKNREIVESAFPEKEENKIKEAVKHFDEKGFDENFSYEVQGNGNETLYSIAIKIINNKMDVKDRITARSLFTDKANEKGFFEPINKGEKISIWKPENESNNENSYGFEIGDNFYVIDIKNNILYKVDDNSDSDSNNNIDTSNKELDLTNEEIDKLISAIKVETHKAEVGVFAGEEDVYCIKVGNFIEWWLPTTKEPVDILVDLDPEKIIKETKNVLSGEAVENIKITDLMPSSSNQIEIDNETKRAALDNFKFFVNSLYFGTEFKKYPEMLSTD